MLSQAEQEFRRTTVTKADRLKLLLLHDLYRAAQLLAFAPVPFEAARLRKVILRFVDESWPVPSVGRDRPQQRKANRPQEDTP